MFARIVPALVLSVLVVGSASAQGRGSHPSGRARAEAARAHATVRATAAAEANAPRPTYADRRFRATIALRSGVFSLPKYDVSFLSTGIAFGFGAQVTDTAALVWEVGVSAGVRPLDETDANEDVTGPILEVNLAFSFAVRRQVARRYFEVGPTFVNHWFDVDGRLVQTGLGGGLRVGGGVFLMRPNARLARMLGAEMRLERVSASPAISLDFRWAMGF